MARGDVTVLAGGWSVRNIDLERLAGVVIAVNDAAILAPRWDYAVSMDRLWTEDRFDKLEARVLEQPKRKAWIRSNALQNMTARAAGCPWLTPFLCDWQATFFTSAPDSLNGTNSGACALNLAWQLQPDRVFLLGFDMNRDQNGQAYWYPPYPWSSLEGSTSRGKYEVWRKQFALASESFGRIGAEVFNVSPTSAIETFRRITPHEYLEACT